MRYTFVPILCLFSILSFGVSAKTKVDIFHTEVPMTEEKNARSIAWGQGLEQVLIKASGNENIASNGVIKKALNHGSNYLAQFKYGTLNDEASMVMDFNSAQVMSLLSQADVIYWPTERENILVWLVDDSGSERLVGWEQSDLESINDLQNASNYFGLPITLPLGDMDDLTNISATDLWGNFAEPLSKASQRYPSDAVLVLKVSHEASQAQVDWQLYDFAPEKISSNKTAPLSGSELGNTSDAIRDSIAKVSAYYAQQNKASANQQADDSLQANFSGIYNVTDFFTLERLLKSLKSVASVQVRSIQGSQVNFTIELFTTVADFEKEAAKKRNLTQTEAPKFNNIQTMPTEEESLQTGDIQQSSQEIKSGDQLEVEHNSKPQEDIANNENSLWFDVK